MVTPKHENHPDFGNLPRISKIEQLFPKFDLSHNGGSQRRKMAFSEWPPPKHENHPDFGNSLIGDSIVMDDDVITLRDHVGGIEKKDLTISRVSARCLLHSRSS